MTDWREVPPTAGLPPRWGDLLPSSTDFAAALAARFDLPAPLLECSGTAALVVALQGLRQLSSRRRVIVPAYTCPLVAIAVAHCGLDVLLCDLAPDSVDFDLLQLAQLVHDEQYHDDILAIIPTHLGGRVGNVEALLPLLQRDGIYVIEDAAQAVGATVGGESVGLRGHAGFFSFAIGKGLNLYEGGALFTRDASLRGLFRATHEQRIGFDAGWELWRSLQYAASTLLYRPAALRHVYGAGFRRAVGQGDWVDAVGDRFDLQIPLHTLGWWRRHCGARALARLPAFLQQTREQALPRIERLQRSGHLTVLQDAPGIDACGTWPLLMVRLPTRRARDAALAALAPQGLGVSRLFVEALPDYDYLRQVVPQPQWQIPNARQLAATMLTISNSPWLDAARFAHIADTLDAVVLREI